MSPAPLIPSSHITPSSQSSSSPSSSSEQPINSSSKKSGKSGVSVSNWLGLMASTPAARLQKHQRKGISDNPMNINDSNSPIITNNNIDNGTSTNSNNIIMNRQHVHSASTAASMGGVIMTSSNSAAVSMMYQQHQQQNYHLQNIRSIEVKKNFKQQNSTELKQHDDSMAFKVVSHNQHRSFDIHDSMDIDTRSHHHSNHHQIINSSTQQQRLHQAINPLYIPEILEIIFSFLQGQIITGFDPTLPLDFVKADSIKYTITKPKLHGVAQVCKLWYACAMKHLWKNVKIGRYANCERLAYSLAISSLDSEKMQYLADINCISREFCMSLPPRPLLLGGTNKFIYGNYIRSIALVPPHTSSGVNFEEWRIDNLVSIIASTCPRLEDLNLSNCFAVTDHSLVQVARNCPNIKRLNLNRCDLVTDFSLLEFAKHLRKLEMLNLSRPLLSARAHVSDSAIQEILKNNPSIKELRLRNCEKTSDATVIALGKYCGQSILALDLSWCCAITDAGIINGIGTNCPNLVSLALNGCKHLSDASLSAILTTCPSIQSLSLAHLPAIQDSVLTNMAERLKNLRILSLNGCNNIRDSSIIAIAQNCPQLQSLSMFSLDITDRSIVLVSQYCPRLNALSISGCKKVTDDGAVHIANLPLITSLYLNAANISDRSVVEIARSCRRIRALSLNDCTSLTDKSAIALASFCTSLQSLSMNKCSITNCGVRAVVERCHDLREISLKDCVLVDLTGPNSIHPVSGNGGQTYYNAAVGALIYQYILKRRMAVLLGSSGSS